MLQELIVRLHERLLKRRMGIIEVVSQYVFPIMKAMRCLGFRCLDDGCPAYLQLVNFPSFCGSGPPIKIENDHPVRSPSISRTCLRTDEHSSIALENLLSIELRDGVYTLTLDILLGYVMD